MKCPGQDTQYWKPGAIFEASCPQCGTTVEFFKDDTTRKCGRCGHRFVNPHMDFGCAAYCQYAEQCIGTLPPEVVQANADLFKDRLAVAVKRHFGSDFKRIAHTVRVARHAEQIGLSEKGNPAVVLSAAYLLDVGRNGSDAASEAEATAASMLSDLGAGEDLIRDVSSILGRHSGGGPDSLEYRIVCDADRMARLEQSFKENPPDPGALEKELAGFVTESGRRMAADLFAQKVN